MYEDLLKQAVKLATLDVKKPKQARMAWDVARRWPRPAPVLAWFWSRPFRVL